MDINDFFKEVEDKLPEGFPELPDDEETDICPICLDEKPVDDLHRNCGK